MTSLSVSADGGYLAFSMDVFVDCDTLQCTADRLAAREESKVTGRVYDKLFIRHWDTWKDGRRSHVFTMPAGGGEPADVMAGMDADCPSKPFGGPEDYTFAPDGSSVVFAARVAGDGEPWSTNFDLYLDARREADEPDRGQRGLGRSTRVLARRDPTRLAGDDAAGIRGRPLPDRAA